MVKGPDDFWPKDRVTTWEEAKVLWTHTQGLALYRRIVHVVFDSIGLILLVAFGVWLFWNAFVWPILSTILIEMELYDPLTGKLGL